MGIVILGKKVYLLNQLPANKRCGVFILNPILMNCVFAKNGASVWEYHCWELLVVTENLNGKRFPGLAAQILAWREAFSSFYLSVVNMEFVLYAPQVSWIVGAFHNCCPWELAGQLSALEEEDGWSLDSPFLSGFRSRAAAPLCLAQNWTL